MDGFVIIPFRYYKFYYSHKLNTAQNIFMSNNHTYNIKNKNDHFPSCLFVEEPIKLSVRHLTFCFNK